MTRTRATSTTLFIIVVVLVTTLATVFAIVIVIAIVVVTVIVVIIVIICAIVLEIAMSIDKVVIVVVIVVVPLVYVAVASVVVVATTNVIDRKSYIPRLMSKSKSKHQTTSKINGQSKMTNLVAHVPISIIATETVVVIVLRLGTLYY